MADAFPAHPDPRVSAWIRHAEMHDREWLRAHIADDAVFHSPVVHTPQAGHEKVFAYLDAAGHVFADTGFRYVRVIVDGDETVLEFEAEIDGIHVNGIDMIRWTEGDLIADFKVMVRPYKAVTMLWEKMAAQLKG